MDFKMDIAEPENVVKYCLRCGSPTFLPQRDHSFKCDSCGFHFYLNSAAAVAALIVNEKKELLLTIRGIEPGKGMLDLPGGFVDRNESAEEALLREIREELGLEIEDYKYFVSYPNEYVFSGFKVYTTDLGFICTVRDFQCMKAQDDISAFVFIKKEDIDYSRILGKSIRRMVQDFFNS